jgi:hypothetical protein
MSKNISKYVVIKTGDPVRGEHTNIGVIVFDGDGNQHSYRLDDLTRAKARGDYPAADPGEWISRWAESLSSVEILTRRQDTIAAAMSSVWVGELCGAIVGPSELLEHVWDRMVIVRPPTHP